MSNSAVQELPITVYISVPSRYIALETSLKSMITARMVASEHSTENRLGVRHTYKEPQGVINVWNSTVWLPIGDPGMATGYWSEEAL